MRKLSNLIFISLLLSNIHLNAQLNSERIFVQTDRDYYAPGEIISFNGFVLSAIDSVISRNLFVELWNDSLRQLASLTLPLIDGAGAGAIRIPNESKSSLYFLRAYSDITATQAHPYQFVKTLSRTAKNFTVADELSGIGAPFFYPEGGSLVNQALNHVVFKAGSEFRGSVHNSKGETLATLNPVFNGIGSFTIVPEKGETYTCYWEENDLKGACALPAAVDIGIALHIRQTADTMFIDLDNGGNPDLQVQQLKIHLMISNELAYMVEMNLANRPRFSYFIPLNEFKAARAEIRVLGADNTILASRPVFINRHSLAEQPQVELQKKDLSARGENRVKLQFADTTIRVLSVSVTDADYSVGKGGSGLTAALLSTEGKPVPAAYRSIHTTEQMDLAVQVAFSQQAMLDKTQAATDLPQAHYLQLEGTVLKGKKPLSEKNLLVGIRSASNGKELYKVTTDNNGKFVIDNLVLYGDVFVHCRIPGNEKLELNSTFRLNMPVISEPTGLYAAFEELVRRTSADSSTKVAASSSTQTEAADTLAFAEKSITLSEVVLVANSRALATQRLKALEEKYIVGITSPFSGYYATSETLDVLNDPERVHYLDIFKYMNAKFHQLNTRYVDGQVELLFRDIVIKNYYVDNSKVDRSQLDVITWDHVAAIKFVRYLAADPRLPPSVAIFLKKDGDEGYWEKDRFQLLEQRLTGYPVSPEFKEPDYRKEETRIDKDLRKTISWKPITPVEKGVAEILFYNNDRARKVRIIAEGIKSDGSIVYFEKEIE